MTITGMRRPLLRKALQRPQSVTIGHFQVEDHAFWKLPVTEATASFHEHHGVLSAGHAHKVDLMVEKLEGTCGQEGIAVIIFDQKDSFGH